MVDTDRGCRRRGWGALLGSLADQECERLQGKGQASTLTGSSCPVSVFWAPRNPRAGTKGAIGQRTVEICVGILRKHNTRNPTGPSCCPHRCVCGKT